MSYKYSLLQLKKMGITLLGKNIQISKLCRIYNPQNLILHNNIRIDDYTILSGEGNIEIKNYVHIGSHSTISSTQKIIFENFSGISSGVRLFGGTDDYSGKFLTNPTVPKEYLGIFKGNIILEPHVIVGANSVILPNIILKEGTAIGSQSLVNKSTEPWSIYGGSPAKFIKERKKDCLVLEEILKKSTDKI